MISTQEDKHGSDRYFQPFFGPAVWIIQDGKKSSPIRCLLL